MVIAPSDAAPATTRGRGATTVQGRRTTRSRGAPVGRTNKKSPRGGPRNVVRHGKARTTGNNHNSSTQSVLKWARVDRPLRGTTLTVKMWIPVYQLTSEERVKYNIPDDVPLLLPQPLASEYTEAAIVDAAHPQDVVSPMAMSPLQSASALFETMTDAVPALPRNNSVAFSIDIPSSEGSVESGTAEDETNDFFAKRPRIDEELPGAFLPEQIDDMPVAEIAKTEPNVATDATLNAACAQPLDAIKPATASNNDETKQPPAKRLKVDLEDNDVFRPLSPEAEVETAFIEKQEGPSLGDAMAF